MASRAKSATRTTRTKRRANEIVAAAAEVFARLGYHGATTQDIADVLGIRQASLYYYFRSKEEALELVCLRGVEGYAEQAQAIVKGPGSARERLARLIHNHLAPMIDRPAFVRVFTRERRYLPDASRKRVGRVSRRYERMLQQVFEDGVRRGELRKDLDCRIAALALLGMCNAATAWYGIEPEATLGRIAEEFARLAIHGAGAGQSKPSRAGNGAKPPRARDGAKPSRARNGPRVHSISV